MRQTIDEAVLSLKVRGVTFDPGLSDNELQAAQRRFDIIFPPDLRAFLQSALPVGTADDPHRDLFPDWRSEDPARIQERLDWPFDGIAFDIRNNAFWREEWGSKPAPLEDALAIARSHVSAAPKLIPVFGHRYIPADPPVAGNPVFSVYQTDIIFYGTDLWDYFRNEFGPQSQRTQGQHPKTAYRPIRFWTDLVE